MKKIVLLQHYYNEIGGIETFLYNFCKQFGDKYDITLVCRSISPENALKLAQYVNVVCEVERDIECDICIITSVLVDDEYFTQIKYNKYHQEKMKIHFLLIFQCNQQIFLKDFHVLLKMI